MELEQVLDLKGKEALVYAPPPLVQLLTFIVLYDMTIVSKGHNTIFINQLSNKK